MRARWLYFTLALVFLLSFMTSITGVVRAQAPLLAAPTSLTAVGNGSSVFLDWNDSTELHLAGYNVYRGTTSGGPYTRVATTTVSSYTDSDLTAGIVYYYVVTALDSSRNESAYSNEAYEPHYTYTPFSADLSLIAGDPTGGSFYLTIGLSASPNAGWWVESEVIVVSQPQYQFNFEPVRFILNEANEYKQIVKVSVVAPEGASSGSGLIKVKAVNTPGEPSVGEGSGCRLIITVSEEPPPIPTPTPTSLPRSGACFIATAAYGSYLDSHVETLRSFRDRYLETNPLGSALVSLYYRISPPLAQLIEKHPFLKPLVRVGLLPAVAVSSVALNSNLAEKVALSVAFGLILLTMAIRLRLRPG